MRKQMLPVLSLKPLLQLLLTQDGMFPPQGLFKAWLSLQGLLIAQHRVIILSQHLPETQEEGERCKRDWVSFDAKQGHQILNQNCHFLSSRKCEHRGLWGSSKNIVNKPSLFFTTLHSQRKCCPGCNGWLADRWWDPEPHGQGWLRQRRSALCEVRSPYWREQRLCAACKKRKGEIHENLCKTRWHNLCSSLFRWWEINFTVDMLCTRYICHLYPCVTSSYLGEKWRARTTQSTVRLGSFFIRQ